MRHNIQPDFFTGRVVQAATTVLTSYTLLNNTPNTQTNELDLHCEELERLINNEIGIRNDWGDPIQLAGLIVRLVDQYKSAAIGG